LREHVEGDLVPVDIRRAGWQAVCERLRLLDEAKGTGAVTRVLIDASDGRRVWGAIGVSENLISTSWDALVDSLEYGVQPQTGAGTPLLTQAPSSVGEAPSPTS
jgi:2-isopropylmalate synthase